MKKIGAETDLSQAVVSRVHRIVRAVDSRFPNDLTKVRGNQCLFHYVSSFYSVFSMKATQLRFVSLPVLRKPSKGGGE